MMRSLVLISLCLFLSTVVAATPTPTPTPTPRPIPTLTPTLEPRQCFIQGGPIPAECPDNNIWNSTICKFVCLPCAKTCDICNKGTECRADNNGCMKCQQVAPTCDNVCIEAMNNGTCEFGCEVNFATCTPTCKTPRLGETVRTVSFQLNVKSRRESTDIETVVLLADAMRLIADKAKISRSDYIIDNNDIKRISGYENSRYGKWAIKIGFRAIQHPEGDERRQFIRQLRKIATPTAVTYDAMDSILAGLLIEETETVTEAKEFYEAQTCEDGRIISADKQCLAVTSAAASTSSSTSTPIVAIIAPIIGGIVLLVIIASALIIHRRRANTVKTMEGIARDTVDMEINPAIAVVEVEGVERV